MKVLRINWSAGANGKSFVDNYPSDRISEGDIQDFADKYEQYLKTGEPLGCKLITKSKTEEDEQQFFSFKNIAKVIVYTDVLKNGNNIEKELEGK